MTSFKEQMEMWQFCDFRLLCGKYERAVCLARLPDEFALLKQVETRLVDRTRSDLSQKGINYLDISQVILQINERDRYAGPLLLGRFQVMESWLPGSFYVCDHALPDLLMREGNASTNVRRWPSVKAAETFIKECTPALPRGSKFTPAVDPTASPQGDNDMARPATAQAKVAAAKAARREGKKMDAALDKKDPVKKAAAPAQAPAKQAAPTKKAAAPAKASAKQAAPAKAPAKTPGAPRGEREGTASTMFKKLIREGKKTDDEIFAEVAQAHNLDEKKRSYVAWYRNAMRKAGETVPDAKGGK